MAPDPSDPTATIADMSALDRVVVVVGPTASGKSDLAMAIAQRLGAAEVVNADSMQLYRGMDVGTAKLTEAERGVSGTTCSTSSTSPRARRWRPSSGPRAPRSRTAGRAG